MEDACLITILGVVVTILGYRTRSFRIQPRAGPVFVLVGLLFRVTGPLVTAAGVLLLLVWLIAGALPG